MERITCFSRATSSSNASTRDFGARSSNLSRIAAYPSASVLNLGVTSFSINTVIRWEIPFRSFSSNMTGFSFPFLYLLFSGGWGILATETGLFIRSSSGSIAYSGIKIVDYIPEVGFVYNNHFAALFPQIHGGFDFPPITSIGPARISGITDDQIISF